MAGPASRQPSPGSIAKWALLGVTVLGTMSNNIINVPLHDVARDFDRPVAEAILTVSAFALVLAVAMPLAGWVGDRLGRKRTLVAALVLMLVAQLAAAAAPSLDVLIVTRGVQGLACSAIPPMVMGMLGQLYPTERLRVMGAWAAANGVGQALGPPIGGLVNDLGGWRSIFVAMACATAVVLAIVARTLPHVPGAHTAFHVPGALLLTGGAALVLVGLTAVSQPGSLALACASVVAGVMLLGGFVAVSRGNPRAMIPPRLIVESRFLRSGMAAFAQMFCLGAALVVLPLYLTGTLGLSTTRAGVLFFLLPMAMAVLAPLVSRAAARYTPRVVLRTGLGILVLVSLACGVTLARDDLSGTQVALVCGLLLAVGLGMAMVQTPAAAGATGSPAAKRGAALGLFNMLRFSGSTTGTAWVALTLPTGSMTLVFGGCAVVAVFGLAMSFFGPDPQFDPLPTTP